MKRPQPDIGDILKASFINNMGSARKFKRLWGTTTVGGVEVLNNRQYYYPSSSRSANFEKLFRFLNAYKDVTSSDPKGIDSAWIYLNKNKGSELPPLEESSELASTYHDFVSYNLNQLWWDDNDGPQPDNLTLTTSIVIEAEVTPSWDTSVSTTGLLNPGWDTDTLKQAIINNYDFLWDTCLISQQGVGVINKGSIDSPISGVVLPDEDDLSPNDPWLGVVARYALRSNGIPCIVKDVEIGYAKTMGGRVYSTYVVTLEIAFYSFSTDSAFVQDVVDDLIATYTSKTRTVLSYPNGYWTKFGIQSMDSSDLEDDPDIVTRVYRLWEDEATEVDTAIASIWYSSGGSWYIRADAFNNPRSYGLTYKKLYGYVISLIDSGYKKKKVKWYKKALAVVIFVVSVVLLQPQVGYAAAIVLASLIVNLLTLAFALAGMDDWAAAFAEANKMIEPLVIIASIYLLVTGLNQAYQKAAESAAKEAGKQAAEATIQDVAEELITDLIDDFVEQIVKGATDLFAGNLTNASVSFAAKVTKLLTLPSQIKLNELKDRNKDLKSEYDALVKEMNQEYDVLRGFMYIYSKPATADWSMYAAEFDQPYERGGGPLAMGNIQRTTKQAIRKGTYNDPVFDNILVV